jgi:KipI family sensor histidine kinase inhibitor
MSKPPETRTLPKLSAVADCALLAEFDNCISPTVSEQVLGLSWRLRKSEIPGLLEIVPAYRSLLVHYDPMSTDFEALSDRVKQLARSGSNGTRPCRRWLVPVLYGGEGGPDLEAVARYHGLGVSDVINLHSSAQYRVYMMGFAPGWTYLGGLDSRLATPRLDAPRSRVPAGCISIGGQQAMIGGLAMPSGWRLLGRTPVRTFAPEREPPFFMSPGDEVTFRVVEQAEFERLTILAGEGERVAEEVTAGGVPA